MHEPFSLEPTPAPASNLFGVAEVAPEAGVKKGRAKNAAAPAGAISSARLDPSIPPNLGQPLVVEVPDFSDPNRPKTCLEIDFPLVPINALSALEGNAGKPIYQMSKWWARRRSCVFRALLLAAAMKAPTRKHPDGQPMLGPDGKPIIDEDAAAQAVWDAYYANHQLAPHASGQVGNFKHLKVLDPFMGGGTTLVEGSRLGFQVAGVDLNPVAWFIVKNELACTDPAEVKAFFDQIEAEVKPQIQPFYVTDGVGGTNGRWFDTRSAAAAEHGSDSRATQDGFDPTSLPPAERKHYRYQGPEVIYTFWAKHGPCSKPGCGHRTPIFRSPVVATKRLGVKYLECTCKNKSCGITFHAELGDARIAPDAEHVILANEQAYSVVSGLFARAMMDYEKDGKPFLDARITFLSEHLDTEPGFKCPACGGFAGQYVRDILAKHKSAGKYSEIKKKDFRILPGGQGKKPVYCTLLIDPEWLKGSAGEVASAGAGAASAGAGAALAGAASASARPSSALSGSAAYTGEAGSYQGELGGYIDAPIEATAAWYRARLANLRLIEVRGQVASGVDVANGFPTPTRGFAGPVGGRDRSPVASSGSAVASSGLAVALSGSPVPSSGSSGGSSDSSGRSFNSSGGSRGGAPGENGSSPETSGVRPGASGTSPEAPEEDSEAGEEAAGLPLTITLRDGRVIETGRGTVPKRSAFACGSCGLRSDLLSSVKGYTDRARMESKDATAQRSLPVMVYVLQCYDAARDAEGHPYGGRYFKVPDAGDIERMIAAEREWNARREADLKDFWPRSALPYTWMTHHLNGGIPNWGYTHWYKFFNPRQLLIHGSLLSAILSIGTRYTQGAIEASLSAFQQYLQNQSMQCHFDDTRDGLAVVFANANFRPRQQPLENNFSAPMGRGNWTASALGVIEGMTWAKNPDDTLLDAEGASDKVAMPDGILPGARVMCRSSTEPVEPERSFDLVITDPPFGDNVFYGDLSNYFHVWLRLALRGRYPEQFGPEYVPRSQEAVSDRSRFPRTDEERGMIAANAAYQGLLTACWTEAGRVMKDGGILAFTFHHSADEPWMSTLESLFDAGFLLEATYPIRSDETKGEGGQFGSRKIEYDIIHVCRKRLEEPKPVSWPKMRQWVKAELARLRPLLESYKSRGLQDADIRVILRGKALEFYSRHYGKVLVSAPGGEDGLGADISLSIRDALLGINMLLDESGSQPGDAARPPSIVQPMVYQFLRLFGVRASYSRDEVSKLLRGTAIQRKDFEKTNSSGGAWVVEEGKTVRRALIGERFARMKARPRDEMRTELDQSHFLIGAAFEASGLNIDEEFKNSSFLIRPGVEALLDWYAKAPAGADELGVPRAAALALTLFRKAKEARIIKMRQEDPMLFEEWEAAAV